MTPSPPAALTIAGSDCSAGAGIQADLKTFQYFRTHGLTAVTCVVSETANIVRAVHPVPVEILIDQVSLLLDTFPIAAVKTGMLYSTAHVRAVAALLKSHPQIALVVDPVMIASSGAPLLEASALDAYRSDLLPLARLITPNLPEAEALLGEKIPDEAAMDSAARQLAKQFGTAVLLKGGHLDHEDCLDLLIDGGRRHDFRSPRIDVAGSHGTGCTLSAAVTAGLAAGQSLEESVESAKRYISETLRYSYGFTSHGDILVHALNQGTTLDRNQDVTD